MNQGGWTPRSPPRPTSDLPLPSPHVRVQLAALGEERGSCYLFSPTAPPTHGSRSPVKPYPKSSSGTHAPSLPGPGGSRPGVTVVRC